MGVTFTRTNDRSYAISIKKEGVPVAEMNPAPGFDPFLPHDVLHLVVESELGLKSGVFGQVNDGGDVGTFHFAESHTLSTREVSRRRRKKQKRSHKLKTKGREEAEFSERATYILRMSG